MEAQQYYLPPRENKQCTILCDTYIHLLEQSTQDFGIELTYLIEQYENSNSSIILKKDNNAIGFIIMDDIYYGRLKEFVHFLKYLWIAPQYRKNQYGSKVLKNISQLRHKLTNVKTKIILNIEKTNNKLFNVNELHKANDLQYFYEKNGFIKIDETETHMMLKN